MMIALALTGAGLAAAVGAQAQTVQRSASAELSGFLPINVTRFASLPAQEPTDAVWQLFRNSDFGARASLSIRTVYSPTFAIVDLKIEGVDEPGVRSVHYRALVQRQQNGWTLNQLGRRHRCGGFGSSILPVWTTVACR